MSIINDALKKVQAKLEKKESSMNEANNPQKEQKGPADGTAPQSSNIQSNNSDDTQIIPQPKQVLPPNEMSDFLKENMRHLQEQKSEKTKTEAPEAAAQEEAKPKTTRRAFSIKSFLTVVLTFAICSAVIAGSVYYTLDNLDWRPGKKTLRALKTQPKIMMKKVQLMKKAQPSPPKAVKVKPIIPSMPSTSIKKGSLTLNGIVMMNNRQVALINNEIYETGDFVDGKKIVSISSSRVELQGDEGITILEKK